jgi:hypothetical protein
MKKIPIYFRKKVVFFCVENLSKKSGSTVVWNLPLLVINKLKIFEEKSTLFCNKNHIIPIFFTGNKQYDSCIFAKLRRGDNCKTIAEDLKCEIDPVILWIFAHKNIVYGLFDDFSKHRVPTYIVADTLPEDNPKMCKITFGKLLPHFEIIETNLLTVN